MKHRSPSYSLTMRLRYADRPGQLGAITSAIGQADGLIGAVDIVDVRRDVIVRDITVSTFGVDHGQTTTSRWPTPPAWPASAAGSTRPFGGATRSRSHPEALVT